MVINSEPVFFQLDKLGFSLFFKNSEGRYLSVNHTACSILGKTEAEVVGRDDFEFFEASSARLMVDRDHFVRRLSRAYRFSSVVQSNGKWMRFESLKLPIFSKFDTSLGLIGISLLIESKLSCEVDFLFQHLTDLALGNPNTFISLYCAWANSINRHEPSLIHY